MNTSDPAASHPAGSHPAASEPAAAEGFGTLTVAAVPIGRPGDASPLLAQALAESPLVAAEDTRRLKRLASTLGVEVTGRVVSYWEAVERSRGGRLLDSLRQGHDVLLVSDAGMPGVSDPGYRLVAAAAAAGVRVTALPGPSAVTAALAISGLPSDRFVFEGFPPRKAGERGRRFADLASEPRTLIFFESPRRVAATLPELAGAFGPDRRAVLCRELTKRYEQVVRGTLAELAGAFSGGARGEVTIVVAGAPAAIATLTPEEAADEVVLRERDGMPRNKAIAAVARERGLARSAVYDAMVARARSRL
jgi:16S rRNA (cytidine1402-2'-O)-methyltransferase